MKIFLVPIVVALCTLQVNATHLRAGEITVRQDATGLHVIVTVTVYTNTINTNVLFGGDDDFLDFGDGSDPDGDGTPGILVPETQNTIQEQLGVGIARASFVVEHTYGGPGAYIISYSEPNRNEGIVNMDGSVNTRFYIESQVILDPMLRSYRSPETLVPPIFHAVAGKELSLAMSYVDSSNYSLRYEVVTPRRGRDEEVINYRLPENFSINPFSGLITWDGKFNGTARAAEYAFAVKVMQMDDHNNVVGFFVRDFQIILSEASIDVEIDDNVEADENNAVYVPESDSLEFKVLINASGVDDLEIKTFSELSDTEDAFAMEVYDTVVEAHDVSKVARLKLTNTQDIRRADPYAIVVRVLQTVNGDIFSHDVTYLFKTEDIPLTLPEPETPVAVERFSEREMVAFPNPVNDYLFVDSQALKNGGITFLNLNGKQLVAPADREGVFDLRSFPPGVYLIKTRTEKGKVVFSKVVKR
jgi:hypothetical protein